MNKEHEFKAGEWAWSTYAGWGKCSLSTSNPYCIKHAEDNYTKNGKASTNCLYSSLFTVAQAKLLGHELLAEAKPKVKRWLWAIDGDTLRRPYPSTSFYTEKEANEELSNPRKLPWSEEEFDT